MVPIARRIFDFFASLGLAVVVMVTLGTTCLIATIYESKHGTAAAQRYFYRTGWFAMILVALGIKIFCAMMSRYPWKKHHTGFVLAHIGILTLLTGSLISLRYGFDGNLALFEGDTGDSVTLLDKVVDVDTGSGPPTRIAFDFDKRPPSPAHPRRFPLEDGATLVVDDFAPHVRVSDSFTEGAEGPAALHFVLQAPFATQDGWLVAGDRERERADFGPASFDLRLADDVGAAERLVVTPGQNHLGFVLGADGTLRYALAAAHADGAQGTATVGTPIETPWMGMKVTVDRLFRHAKSGRQLSPETPPAKDERRVPAIKVHIETPGGGTSTGTWLAWANSARVAFGGGAAQLAYHAPTRPLPFRVNLLHFKSDKYQGTNMPATYESFVRVEDPERGVSEHHISMNHPMHYGGSWGFGDYIFFQASYVEGEPMMSIFSVAQAPGLPFVYLGSTLIALGVVCMFYVKPYLARRQAALALAAHKARQKDHAENPQAASAPAPAAPARAQPARGGA